VVLIKELERMAETESLENKCFLLAAADLLSGQVVSVQEIGELDIAATVAVIRLWMSQED
jgi:hypothetical protein